MDDFFHLSPGSMLWLQEVLSTNSQRQSAFSSYTNEPIVGFASSSRENVNKRMIQFLNKSWRTTIGSMERGRGRGRGRGKKHVICERLRREKHRRFYGALHELLPPGTKSDQKSILEMAVKKIEELKKTEGELKRRNNEVEFILGARETEVMTLEKAEIKLQVGNPSSGIDSMLQVVKSLKYTNSTATAIRSHFSQRQFSALLEVETKMKAADVEREVGRSLFEVERKFHDNS